MIELSVDAQALQALGRRLRDEEDGKKLRRDLAKNLRAALEPAKDEVRSALMGMATAGLEVDGAPLRTTVLKGLKAEARLTGRKTGARLKIKKTPELRNFKNAPKRLNSKKGWRHRVFGQDVWVTQVGEREYFDRTIRTGQGRYRAAVRAAMAETARRITRKV
ncbi:hypothetical protein ACFP2T_13480 [Plantactinospora solaniradicis]|uniref:HK97 gp10 family phage protein n=1 Tax=Plantactinospora solaniradicis TaxID=1723736 RepID=A0ABW1K874_9ACTN